MLCMYVYACVDMLIPNILHTYVRMYIHISITYVCTYIICTSLGASSLLYVLCINVCIYSTYVHMYVHNMNKTACVWALNQICWVTV